MGVDDVGDLRNPAPIDDEDQVQEAAEFERERQLLQQERDELDRQRGIGLGVFEGLDWEWEIVRRGRILGKLLLMFSGGRRLQTCKRGLETSY